MYLGKTWKMAQGLAPANHLGNLDGIPGSWLLLIPDPAIVAILATNRLDGISLFLCLPLCNFVFQIKSFLKKLKPPPPPQASQYYTFIYYSLIYATEISALVTNLNLMYISSRWADRKFLLSILSMFIML